MPALNSVYLVCGQDDVKIDSWRSRLRRRAESERGPGALERFDATTASPAEVCYALQTLTLEPGPRYVLCDGIERWKPAEVEPLSQALAHMPAETVLVLIARGNPPSSVRQMIEQSGGEVHLYQSPPQRQLPAWVSARARERGLELDRDACKALIGAVGPRQQRLIREIEKLGASVHPKTRLAATDIERLASSELSARAYELADAVVAGDRRAAFGVFEQLRSGGEPPGRLIFSVARRLREVLAVHERLVAGESETTVASQLKLPSWIAKRTVAEAKRCDVEALRGAVCALHDCEVRMRSGEVDDETAFTLALSEAAA